VYLSPRKMVLMVTLFMSVSVSVLAWSFVPNLSDFVVQKVYPLGYLVESNGDLDDHLLIQRKPKG